MKIRVWLLAAVLCGWPAVASAQHGLQDLQDAGKTALRLAGEWKIVSGTHAGKKLTKEQMERIRFTVGHGYGIELGPLVPRGNWPTGYLLTLHGPGGLLMFSRNIGLKAVGYYGYHELKDDTLRITLQLLPWERSTADPGYVWNSGHFTADTVLEFRRVKQ